MNNSLAKDFVELALEKDLTTLELLASLMSAMFATTLMVTDGKPEAERVSALLELRRMFERSHEHAMSRVLAEADV